MIKISYYDDKDLARFKDYRIVETEIIKSQYGDRKYVTFGAGLTVGYDSEYLGDGDSVWYVKIWNPVTKREEAIGMGYVDMAPDQDSRVQYDATPEVKAEWEAWKVEQEKIREEKRLEYEAAQKKAREIEEANTPNRGKVVKVVRGRKIAKGTEGLVFWYGQTRFGYRVGLELSDGSRVFTSVDNVVVQQGVTTPATVKLVNTKSYDSRYVVAKVEALEDAVELEDSIYEDGGN